MKNRDKIALTLCFGLTLSVSGRSYQSEASFDILKPNDVQVVKYQPLKYPTSAQAAQGVVVTRVKLNNSGTVVDAEALSGNDTLIPETLINVKTWTFQPNASGSAVIVYNYRIVQGQCKTASSYFQFEPPNYASITACLPRPSEAPAGLTSNPKQTAVINNSEMQVVDFEEMKYPIIAIRANVPGVVVIQADLDESGKIV